MKTNALYMYANKKGSGSLLVSMGLMEILRKNFPKIAFFRPIVETKEDYDIKFINAKYNIRNSLEESYGFSLDEAQHIIASKGAFELFEMLLEKFKKLQEKFDFVLCEGIYSELFSNIVELDINIEIAKNFSIPVINLINADEDDISVVLDEITLQKSSMKKANLNNVATILNLAKDIQRLKDYIKDETVYIIPYIKELSRLSLADLADNKEIENLNLNEFDYAKTIGDIKVAAMSLDNYLGDIKKDDLVVVPADRSEILLALIASYHSKNYPNISGIIFSYDTKPHKNIQKLIDGFDDINIPVFSTKYDTYKTVEILSAIEPKIRIEDKKKITFALGVFFKYVDTLLIESKIKNSDINVITPVMFEYLLFQKAREDKKKIVLPESNDERILKAAQTVLNTGIADLIFLANKDEFKNFYQKLGLDLSKAEVIDVEDEAYLNRFGEIFYNLRKHKGLTKDNAKDIMRHVNYFATMLVYTGYADAMVSGASHSTAETVRPALEIIKTKEGVGSVSSIFFMCLDTKVHIYGDCAIIKNPTSAQLSEIAILANDNAKRFDINPKVAMLSYSSGDSGSGEDVDKVKEAVLLVKKSRKDIQMLR